MVLFIGGPEIILFLIVITVVVYILNSKSSENSKDEKNTDVYDNFLSGVDELLDDRNKKKDLTDDKEPIGFFLNAIIFLVLWFVILAILMAGGIAVGIWDGNVIRPSGFPAICGIVAIILAYRLVKKINSSFQNSNKASSHYSIADELTKLGKLKEKGLLTEEEFNEQKKKLLKQ